MPEYSEFQVKLGETELTFVTKAQVFSPHGADRGTLAMLSVVELEPEDRLLDLGCGYGLVGIWAAKQLGSQNVVMCDISKVAVETARENCIRNGVDVTVVQSDGFRGLSSPSPLEKTGWSKYTKILSNPPYHEDFSVPKHFIEEGFRRLETGGKLYMVTKRKDWYFNKIKAVFGGVHVDEIDGYYVFSAQKRTEKRPEKKKNEQIMSRKLQRKMNMRKRNRFFSEEQTGTEEQSVRYKNDRKDHEDYQ